MNRKLVLSAVVLAVVACGDAPTTPLAEDDGPASTMDKAQLLADFLANPRVPAESQGPMAVSGSLTYTGKLVNGHSQTGTTGYLFGPPEAWDYWYFTACAGTYVQIEAHRLIADSDPAAGVYSGMSDDSEGLEPFGGGNADLTYVAWGDDEVGFFTGGGHGIGGFFGDPRIAFTPTVSGVYTLAVNDWWTTPNPYDLYASGLFDIRGALEGLFEGPNAPSFPPRIQEQIIESLSTNPWMIGLMCFLYGVD